MTRPAQSSPRATNVASLDQRTPSLLEVMADLFEQGQNRIMTDSPAISVLLMTARLSYNIVRGFLKPRNPLRKRHGYAKGWFVDGLLVGYLLYRLRESNNVFYGKTRWTCFVEDIVVDENARGLGGASALMQALLQEVEALENCAVSGTVWNGNTASEGLFEKHGFEPLSKAFYKVSK